MTAVEVVGVYRETSALLIAEGWQKGDWMSPGGRRCLGQALGRVLFGTDDQEAWEGRQADTRAVVAPLMDVMHGVGHELLPEAPDCSCCDTCGGWESRAVINTVVGWNDQHTLDDVLLALETAAVHVEETQAQVPGQQKLVLV